MLINKDAIRVFFADPRIYQIVALSSFAVFGLAFGLLQIKLLHIVLYIFCALLMQSTLDVLRGSPWNWRSAIITALSLSLLLRVNAAHEAAICATIAIASKVLIRYKGKHVFNPANFAIVLGVFLFDAWISPAQWGHAGMLMLAFCGIGLLVTYRATRADVAIVFLLVYVCLLLLRNLYLNDPFDIFIHQLNNGALYLFAFFMITDPKTTPEHIVARYIYAVVLAVLTYYLQFYAFLSQAMLYALFFSCMSVPLLNARWVGESYMWNVDVKTAMECRQDDGR